MAGTSWNDIPFNENDTPADKADNFDRQYQESRISGNHKEVSGAHRPEPSIGNEGKKQ